MGHRMLTVEGKARLRCEEIFRLDVRAELEKKKDQMVVVGDSPMGSFPRWSLDLVLGAAGA